MMKDQLVCGMKDQLGSRKPRLIFCESNGTTIAQAWRSSSTIELNIQYLGLYDLKEVLTHELCHLIVEGGHNKEWKRLMRSFGYDPKLKLEV